MVVLVLFYFNSFRWKSIEGRRKSGCGLWGGCSKRFFFFSFVESVFFFFEVRWGLFRDWFFLSKDIVFFFSRYLLRRSKSGVWWESIGSVGRGFSKFGVGRKVKVIGVVYVSSGFKRLWFRKRRRGYRFSFMRFRKVRKGFRGFCGYLKE